MLANLVCSLIKHRRVTTTLAKAKAARSVAEKMVTLAKGGTLHHRRLASARLFQDEAACRILFTDLAPIMKDRRGGYTRIIKLVNRRRGDASQQAIIEFVGGPEAAPAPVATETKSAEASPAPASDKK
jgi:large subunit ribosomal protein L17